MQTEFYDLFEEPLKYKIKNYVDHYKNMNIKKPSWIKIRTPSYSKEKIIQNVKNIIKFYELHTVCEESSCPNLIECYQKKVVTFLILGSSCTRCCHFCKVQKGKPDLINFEEPKKISRAISKMNLRHVVITSVSRDDLPDKGADHFLRCVQSIRKRNKGTTIELLVPDFHPVPKEALNTLKICPPDIFGHNIESVKRIYRRIRPGSDYQRSLNLLYLFKTMNPDIPTKSGLMVGLGETDEEIISTLKDLRKNGVTILTIGQYLKPSKNHFPISRYLDLKEFHDLKIKAKDLGFKQVSCGPLVRSSYNAIRFFKKNPYL
ncbi:lipoyl synthase [Candidatus Riesia pediculischaeffi]|uniref:lipoyl synthase n=1 Tax=Candidatus Riesia pediculischaeffi TaxID=428411 RepID=UPI002A4E1CB2|nr:lipoyl synthase [Candidatus Riesia pediculischaeffi]